MKKIVYPYLYLLIIFPTALWGQNTASNSHSLQKVLSGAHSQIGITKSYDPTYTKMAYPMGDVPMETGVCTDVVIRAFRNAGVDLQELVHKDMKKNFHRYPKQWGLKSTDRNIDHRRVPNLMTFFKRQGKSLPISKISSQYRAGDVVAWRLPNGLFHIGIVSDQKVPEKNHPLVVHNIGAGAQLEDILFEYKIIGHYRYF